MAPYTTIIPPASLGEALQPLSELSDSEFNEFISAVSGPRSYSLPKEDLDVLRKRIPSEAANLTYILGALSFLYAHVSRSVDAGIPFDEAIRATTDALEKQAEWGSKKDAVRERLARLLRQTEAHQRFRKIQRLQSGFIPNALGFSSFVDLRPDFGDGDELTLRGYVPIVQFRISTDSASLDAKRFVFQMNEEALSDLKKAIKRAEDKLSILKDRPELLTQLIKI
jgi:hypothetical protein